MTEINEQNALAEKNIKLVYKPANFYARKCKIPQEDLIQDGLYGLVLASRHFDKKRGIRFSTYATKCIKAKIKRSIENTNHLIRVKNKVFALVTKVRNLAKTMTIGEAMDKLRLTKQQKRMVTSAITCQKQTTPYVYDLQIPEQPLDNTELVSKLLKQINKKDRQVIEKLFGLSGTALTRGEIAVEWHVSKQMISNRTTRAIRKMRQYIKDHPEITNNV